MLKWFLIASAIGALVGFSTSLFIQLLNNSISYTKQFPFYFLLLPVMMALTIIINNKVSPESEGHGTEKVIEAIHKRSGIIDPKVIPVKLTTTILTLASGGSVGKEGPSAQIGAGLASIFATLCRFSLSARKKLIICGVSAGFASVFGTPIAGSLFGVEVLTVGQLRYEVMYPSFIAGIVGYHTASLMGIHYFRQPLRLSFDLSNQMLLEVLLTGVLCSICSYVFIESLYLFKKISHSIPVRPYLKGLLGGSLVLASLLVSDRYLGLGLGPTEQALSGQYLAQWYDPLLKIYTTATTLEFGGSGGIITPIMNIGSMFGSGVGQMLGQQPAVFAALGMVGVLAGCTNTPVACSILAIEMFGPEIGLYAAMVSMISFIMTGHRSVYPSQILSIKKSESLMVELGQTIEELQEKHYGPK